VASAASVDDVAVGLLLLVAVVVAGRLCKKRGTMYADETVAHGTKELQLHARTGVIEPDARLNARRSAGFVSSWSGECHAHF